VVLALTLKIGENITRRVFGLTVDVDIVWSTLVAALIVVGLGLYARATFRPESPSRFQVIVEWLLSMVSKELGDRNRPGAKWMYAIAVTCFSFILVSNWLELIPSGHDPEYLPAPTSNVNATFAMGVAVIIFIHVQSLRALKAKGYIKHYFQPFALMFPINLIEELSKPVTLSLRLFANLFAGSTMLALLAALPFFVPTLVLDPVWKLIDAFIGFIQAYIFTVLSITYYNLAVGSSH
jgi:F-type H+-transporting ATPase subunit a